MKTERADYLSISEFSEIAEVSRKALIFYDNIGIFSPRYRAANGYRYYSHEQIYLISVITMFRELGMSLGQIREYLGNRNPQDVMPFLKQAMGTLEQKMERLRGAREMLGVKLGVLEQGLGVDEGAIAIVEEPRRYLFVSDELGKRKSEIPDEEWMGFYRKCHERNIIWGYPEGFSTSREDLQSGRFDVASHIICHVGSKKYANASIPAGRYLSAFGPGSFLDTEPIYERLFRYIKGEGLEIVGPSYEKRLIDEAESDNYDTQVMQVEIRIGESK